MSSPYRTSPAGRQSARLNLEILEDRNLLSAAPADFTVDPNRYETDHILVRWNDGAAAADTALDSGMTSIGNNTYAVNLNPGVTASEAVNYYQHLTGVAFAQPDYILSLTGTPNDPGFNSQWSLQNNGQTGGTPGADIGATKAWNYTTGNKNIIIAVIDTGVDYNHPDLAANIWHNPYANTDGIANDYYGADFSGSTPTGNPLDLNGHGTNVAGIIGAVGNNGIGVSGVDPNVQIMALKFTDASGNGTTAHAIQAIYWAVDHGAKIINNRWGGSGYDSGLNYAVIYAKNHGVIVVAAAGNNASNNDATPFYPANLTQDNIVSVAATDSNDRLAAFSDYGARTVSLAAPGVSIYSTYPTNLDPSNPYRSYSGTSQAAPEVAGAMALVWSAHPDWTYTQVIGAVLINTDSGNGLGGRVETGRLNVYKAIANTTTAPAPTPPISTPAPSPTAPTITRSTESGNVNIPIRSLQTATATLTVPTHLTISNLTVKVNVSAIYDAGLIIKLVSPTGKEVILSNGRGGSGNRFSFTIFDDSAATPIAAGQAPFSGTFRPDGALSSFNGTDFFGTWKLVVVATSSNSAGTIQNFTITASGSVASFLKTAGEEDGSSFTTPLTAVAPPATTARSAESDPPMIEQPTSTASVAQGEPSVTWMFIPASEPVTMRASSPTVPPRAVDPEPPRVQADIRSSSTLSAAESDQNEKDLEALLSGIFANAGL